MGQCWLLSWQAAESLSWVGWMIVGLLMSDSMWDSGFLIVCSCDLFLAGCAYSPCSPGRLAVRLPKLWGKPANPLYLHLHLFLHLHIVFLPLVSTTHRSGCLSACLAQVWMRWQRASSFCSQQEMLDVGLLSALAARQAGSWTGRSFPKQQPSLSLVSFASSPNPDLRDSLPPGPKVTQPTWDDIFVFDVSRHQLTLMLSRRHIMFSQVKYKMCSSRGLSPMMMPDLVMSWFIQGINSPPSHRFVVSRRTENDLHFSTGPNNRLLGSSAFQTDV